MFVLNVQHAQNRWKSISLETSGSRLFLCIYALLFCVGVPDIKKQQIADYILKHIRIKHNPPYTKKQLLTHIQACDKAPLSYKEMAEVVGCSKKFAKIVAKENAAAKVIVIENTCYKFGISGKNKYSRGKNFSPKKHLIPGVRVVVKKVCKDLIINVML